MKVDPKSINEGTKERVQKIRAVLPPVPARFKKQSLQEQTEEALQNVPRITNETVAEHREKVLKGARKYKYPLQHSKHKIVVVTISLLVTAIVGFLVAVMISLYKLQSTSSFMYHVTQVLPLPVAKVDRSYVSYNSYLFDIRRYMHYYRTQQQVDFTSEVGKDQLEQYKPQALQAAEQMVYVKRLASQNGISVSDSEVNDTIAVLKAKDHLGSDKELASVLKRFYDWSIDDLKRALKDELLAQKVAAQLDNTNAKRAADILAQARSGKDFGELAKSSSDDIQTKENGGQYSDTAITLSSKEVPPAVVRQLAKMKPGDVSDVIVTPTAYEIVKLLEATPDGKYKAAHIQIKFQSVEAYTQPLADKAKVHKFIKVQDMPQQNVIPGASK